MGLQVRRRLRKSSIGLGEVAATMPAICTWISCDKSCSERSGAMGTAATGATGMTGTATAGASGATGTAWTGAATTGAGEGARRWRLGSGDDGGGDEDDDDGDGERGLLESMETGDETGTRSRAGGGGFSRLVNAGNDEICAWFLSVEAPGSVLIQALAWGRGNVREGVGEWKLLGGCKE